MDEKKQSMYCFHLAGIVPVAGEKLDFGFPWNDSLAQISKEYTAVEHAVAACAAAGCETIFLVCHNDTTPLLRYVVGDWVYDPVTLNKPVLGAQKEYRIPIFYVPIHSKDRFKKDSLSWSALYGAQSAHFLGKNISKWLAPDKYFVAWPYGITDLNFIRGLRKKISSQETVMITNNGESVKTGAFLPFTFDATDYKKCRDWIKNNTTHNFARDGSKIPLTEKWSAKHFSLKQVFSDYEPDLEFCTDDYFDISSWEKLRSFYGSERGAQIAKKPFKTIRGSESNPIGKDVD